MKRLLLIFILVFIFLNVNIYGQNAYIGKIVEKGNPCPPSDFPCLPGTVLWLETSSGNYVLTIDSNWIGSNKVIVGKIEYSVGDEVEIKGIVNVKTDLHSQEYSELEIQTINKWTSNIEPLYSYKNKIYYDNLNQKIVIDKDLQNQSFTLEIIDIQGKVMLRKTGLDSKSSISIVNLQNGIYLYCLTKNEVLIFTGKILKK